MGLRIFKDAWNPCAPFIRHERHMVPARHQFLRDGMRGHQMPACAASRHDIMAEYAHRPLHFTT